MQQSQVKYKADDFFVLQPSDISFSAGKNPTVTIDGTWDLKLDRRHNTIGQLQLGVDPELLKPQFMDGRFFIVDDEIVDYRLADRVGFVHSQDSIKALVDNIGFTSVRSRKGSYAIKAGNTTSQIDYEAFSTDGGHFDVNIGFAWSPFSMDIESVLSILRLICENGMTINSPVVNAKIPMVSTWVENLAISNDVINHQFQKVIGPRMKMLRDERASMYDVSTLRAVLNDLRGSKKITVDQDSKLAAIQAKLDPLFTPELGRINRGQLKFIPAPLTGFDAMNIATECATHLVGEDRTPAKANMFANSLIFDERRQRNIDVDLSTLVCDTMTFHTPDQAFHGVTCH